MKDVANSMSPQQKPFIVHIFRAEPKRIRDLTLIMRIRSTMVAISTLRATPQSIMPGRSLLKDRIWLIPLYLHPISTRRRTANWKRFIGRKNS